MSTATPVRYPWDQWFATTRKQRRLVRGKHFHCQPHSMSIQVRAAAALRGLRVSVYIEEQTLIVTLREKKGK